MLATPHARLPLQASSPTKRYPACPLSGSLLAPGGRVVLEPALSPTMKMMVPTMEMMVQMDA